MLARRRLPSQPQPVRVREERANGRVQRDKQGQRRDHDRYRMAGFTLIELLTVIAIIVILLGILIPTIGGARTSALKAKTRVQFSQWASAIEGFRQEYGYYPAFTFADEPSDDGWINNASETQEFVETLSGRQLDGRPLNTGGSPSPGYAAGNVKGIHFCSFGPDDLQKQANGSSLLQDALGNIEIRVFVDRTYDGMITFGGTNADYTGVPAAIANLSGTPVFPNNEPVRAGVIFLSFGPTQNSADVVKSW